MTTPTETFMKKAGDQITNDIARLRDARFVTTTEAEEGRKMVLVTGKNEQIDSKKNPPMSGECCKLFLRFVLRFAQIDFFKNDRCTNTKGCAGQRKAGACYILKSYK